MTGTPLSMTDELRESLAKLFAGPSGQLTMDEMRLTAAHRPLVWASALGPDRGTAHLPHGFVGAVHEFRPGSCGCVVLRNKGSDDGTYPPPEYTSLPPVLDCPWCDAHASILCRDHPTKAGFWQLQVTCSECGSNSVVETDRLKGDAKGMVLDTWRTTLQRWNRQAMGSRLLRSHMSDPMLSSVFGAMPFGG